MKMWPVGAARTAEIVVGLTYLIAAGLKATAINGFLPQIRAYQIVESNSGLIVVALIALALETFLGVCMVLGVPWRRLVLGLGAAMLCFFTAVIIYAWQVHDLSDCGCFGKVKFTPPQAIAKNIVMLALTALAYYGLVMRREVLPEPSVGRKRVIGATVLALVLCAYAVPQLGLTPGTPTVDPIAPEPTESMAGEGATNEALPPSDARPESKPGPFAEYVITTEFDQTYDLGQGEYLVALLSMTCDHCMESVPQLNEFYYANNLLPPLVAICLEPEPGSMEEFRMFTQPQFPLHSLEDKSLRFFPLLESASVPPRLVYVRDGRSVVSWDGEMPDFETLASGLAEAGYAQNEKSDSTGGDPLP